MSRSRAFLPIAFATIICLAGAAYVLARWGLRDLVPGLLGNFAASLAAFMLALAWESDRERRKLLSTAKEFDRRRATEVRRRLSAVKAELEKNAESVTDVISFLSKPPAPYTFSLVHPQLLEGAWSANASAIAELLADYGLTSDLSVTYGRIEELRWRLRFRSSQRTNELDAITLPLAEELRDELSDLLERVGAMINKPEVQPIGLAHKMRLGANVSVRGELGLKVIRADGSVEMPDGD
jgi:hypothetical protein